MASDPVRPAEKTDKRDILRPSGEVAPIDRNVTSTFEQASAWKHGIRDERLTLKDFSIGFLMKEGLQLPKWKDFLDLYNKAKEDVYNMTAKERNQYKKQRKSLYVDTIKKCDVVFCTDHAFAGQVVRSLEHITATFTDEAAKASENQLIPILMHKGCRFFGLFGDQYQLPPHVAETSDENSLMDQAKLSLFKRLIMIGVKSTMLLEPFRMVSGISEYDSYLFYKGRLRTGELATENHPSRVEITQRKSFKELHFGNSSLLLSVNDDEGAEAAVGTSKYNKGNAEMVINLVVKLLQANTVSADDIRILTPVRPRREMYISALNNASTKFAELPISDVIVLVATIESVQGQENKVVAFDTVVTDKIGFLEPKPRINVAVSRTQLALYQIVNKKSSMTAREMATVYLRRCSDILTVMVTVPNAYQKPNQGLMGASKHPVTRYSLVTSSGSTTTTLISTRLNWSRICPMTFASRTSRMTKMPMCRMGMEVVPMPGSGMVIVPMPIPAHLTKSNNRCAMTYSPAVKRLT